MKAKGKRVVILLAVLAAGALLAGGMLYIAGVQKALWNEAVTNILEVTAQGRHTLDTCLEKDKEALHLLASELGKVSSDDSVRIREKINLYSEQGTNFLCLDIKTGTGYTNELPDSFIMPKEQLADFQSMEGRGVREPFLEGYTGVWNVGVYERFQFADGAEGYVQKIQPRADMAERFSLSFYNDTGFSYVVNRKGDILIRSMHRNSNRTFQNLFDIVGLQDNKEESVDSFRHALEKGKRGVARFRYQKEDYVFCYVPLENAGDWYVISIVPNGIIMEQANNILRQSWIMFVLILASVFVLTSFFLVYWDSARRVLRAEEEARIAAESANIAKSRFLSNMSHDIRTPMNAVIGMTRLASDHVNDPEKVRKYLENIRMSGQLLVGLINDILDMSKIESGKMILNNDTTSLVDLMTDLVNIIQPSVWQKQQEFNIRLHGIVHETLCFDSLRMNQILINLLSNAIKYTPEKGRISVDLTESPSAKDNCAHFTFQITDTGIGMKPEFLENLFTSFMREQDSRVNRIEGTGLGMAITKMIVDLMEGTIAVKSTPGKGTTFTVELDLLLEEKAAGEEPHLPPLRVLVADDDEATCQSAEAFLRELGVEPDIVESGRDAVEKAAAAHRMGKDYCLVLLDWRMPDMNGVNALRAIRAKTGEELPVVIFSAYDWSHIELEALDAGATGFVQKPLFKSTLRRCIQRYVLHEFSQTKASNNAEELAGRCILLAEDNILNQEIAKELLEGYGAMVDAVEDGLKCVEWFKRSEPGYYDLILMDIHMPVMNGYEAVRKIRGMERPDAASIPIFAMTADAFAEDIEETKKAGMNSHLAKPLDIPAMLREIKKYLLK